MSQRQEANLVRWAGITACDLWEPSPQAEVPGADTDREEKEDVSNKPLPSLPELGLVGGQKLVPHIQMSYWLCGDGILPLGKQQFLAPAEFLPASSTTDLEKKNALWHIILDKLLTLVYEGWEETILSVHTALFSVSSNSLSTALKKKKKVWAEGRKFSLISVCKKSLLQMIEFSRVWGECNNCLIMWSLKLYPADSVGGFCRQEKVNYPKLDPDQD